MLGWLVFAGVALSVFAADMVSKYWAFATVAGIPVRPDPSYPGSGIPEHASIAVIPHVLDLHLILNRGAVFGMGQGQQGLFVVVSVLASLFIVWMMSVSSRRAWLMHVALGLILAGALGNLYDRVMFGAVRDLFWMLPTLGLWPWIFNLADAVLMTGVGLILLMSFRGGQRAEPASA
ncbi:signal peptidase II [Mucisphaera calidilacus]|uniref:Lipoprotein signal peptidase n=1 Tax=Mucisphaera calidilacus TaxID=2527982 RepID=A0A518BW89_9BACT|nr:signal peptidase II [Mucisphaera calidilacus]QDU71194.1 Lipoprotein signal peptidase [Mucisphaera calidilacus]